MIDMNVLRGPQEGPAIGSVAMTVRDHINAQTFTSMLHTDWKWIPPGYRVNHMVVQGSVLTTQRNQCVRDMDGGWLLFIDDDMVFGPHEIGNIVASWAEVQEQFDDPVLMGGLCSRRAHPYDATLYMREEPTHGRYRFLEKWDTDIVEVDATGCAFLLIPVGVFERLAKRAGTEWPDRETRMKYTPPPLFRWDGMFGEDLAFCQDVKNAGCRIFVDTRIKIGHVTEIVADYRDFLRAVAERPQDQEDKVREMNDKLGLPTLTAEEARARLAG